MPNDIFNTDQLQRLPLFQTVSGGQLSKLAANLQRAHFNAGDILAYEGDRGDSSFVLLAGEVDIIKSLGKPEESILFTTGAGDFIGEMSLFEPDGVRVATIRAKSAVDALLITRELFENLIHNEPELAFEISRILVLRVRDSNDRLYAKNEALEKALTQLKAAQAELIDKERMERELELARTIQEDILPKEFPQPDRYGLGARMNPAREVGGDFFDFIRLSDHRIGVLIGDVSDKGVPAAIYMALTRSLIHAEARRSSSPETVLTRVNALLSEMSEAKMFVTTLYGILDCQSGRFEYARAGHELPIILDDANQEHVPPKTPGQPLAMFDEPLFDTQVLQLQPGMSLLLYTDGATDATCPDGSFYGLGQLMDNLRKSHKQNSAQGIVDDLMESILNHQHNATQYDDITLIAIRAYPTPTQS